MFFGIVTGSAVGEVVAGEDAFDGTNGRERFYSFTLHFFSDGLRAIVETVVVKIESEHDDDLLNFATTETARM